MTLRINTSQDGNVCTLFGGGSLRVRREARVGERLLSNTDIEKLFAVMDVGRDGRISIDDFMYHSVKHFS